MRPHVSGARWERLLLPLSLLGLLAVLGWYGLVFVNEGFGVQLPFGTGPEILLSNLVPALGYTLLTLMVGVAIQTASPRRSVVFLTFVILELGGLMLTALFAYFIASRFLAGPLVDVRALGLVSLAGGALDILALFVLVLLARPMPTHPIPPPSAGTADFPGPMPPPP